MSGSKTKHCLLLGVNREIAHAAKEMKVRPTPTDKQLADAKSAALIALTPKKGDAPATRGTRMAEEWMTPLDRCRFLNENEQLDLGDRTITAKRRCR